MAIVLTPSRYCAIATVQSSFHIPPTGMQQGAIDFGEPRGFPLKYKLMPQYFQDLGYETHMVGKWGLGYYRTEYTPTMRGFDTFYGYYNADEDYYNHSLAQVSDCSLVM